jgi:hypothetical protein
LEENIEGNMEEKLEIITQGSISELQDLILERTENKQDRSIKARE